LISVEEVEGVEEVEVEDPDSVKHVSGRLILVEGVEEKVEEELENNNSKDSRGLLNFLVFKMNEPD
jgi:hypothetical protein